MPSDHLSDAIDRLERGHEECVRMYERVTENLVEVSRNLDRVAARLDSQEEKLSDSEETLKALRKSLWSSDPGHPGVSLRLDRMERKGEFWTKALGGGSLMAFVATAVLIWRLLAALADTGT